MADLRVDIASEFTGKAAFTKATKATNSLDKAVGKLGKQLASVFALTKIVAYGKASVKAFIEEERAVSQLTTAVKNLGLAFAQPQINNYISQLESSTAIVDDQLRPAFQALLTTTGSLTKSQELLGLAIEGSRGSGIDLTTVAQDLANAYNGNTRGLRKYNLGLTKAQLTTVSFTEVQQRFANQFSGANAAYLATYAGKLDVLKVASDNAKEAIGKGLVDALVLTGGKDGNVQNVADAMGNLSNYTADTVRGLGVLAGKISSINQSIGGGFLGKLLDLGTQTSLIRLLNRLGADASPRPTAGRRFMGGAQANLYDSSAAAEKKFRDQQKKLAADQLKATKALNAEQKKQAALKKAGSIFDLEQIQIIAALKGQLSDEDRKRVELQLALLTGNTKEATKLATEIAKAQGLGKDLAAFLASLPNAKNPFEAWSTYLDEIMKKAALAASTSGAIAGGGAIGTNFMNSVIQQSGANVPIQTNVIPMPKSASIGSDFMNSVIQQSASNKPVQVTVQIDGKAVASSLRDSSLSGIGSFVDRVAGY